MSQERKKIERVLAPKPEPKKRVEVIEEPKEIINEKPETKKRIAKVEVKREIPKIEIQEVVNDDLVTEAKKTRVKNPDKYIRFSFEELSNSSNISTINRRVLNGEIKYAYYATDNDIGYHYYIINKK
jgi:hypothetical protein